MTFRRCILSVSGPTLLVEERDMLRDMQPWGIILMGRSCQSRDQIQSLIQDIHEALDRPALIFIDQEGGRVARLRAPEWPNFPAAGVFGVLYEKNEEAGLRACYLSHLLMGTELSQLGILADCAPVGDLRQEDTHDAIGDRSFSNSVTSVSELASAALSGLKDAGVLGVIKHLPGQGRAGVDSHHDLPKVTATLDELDDDFSVFSTLAPQAKMAMTGHVSYDALDPSEPATVSEIVISRIIRNRIGFQGILMTDDLGMEALGGDLTHRSERSLEAGCDILLHCSGFLNDPAAILGEMTQVAISAGEATGEVKRRLSAVTDDLPAAIDFDAAHAWSELSSLMSTKMAGV